MILSNAKAEEAKVRDYKIHEETLLQIFKQIGLLFYTKADPFKVAKETFKSDKSPEEEFDVLAKVMPFFPKVDKDTVDTLAKIFSGLGVCQDNNDLLLILRHFHTLKYK